MLECLEQTAMPCSSYHVCTCATERSLKLVQFYHWWKWRVQGEFGNEGKRIAGSGLSALQMWSVTPLKSREAGFSNPCYLSLVIAETDHLRWKYRQICCCWQLTRTSSPFRYIHMHIHSTGKKIISSTLGHCFCGLGICYFTPTCWHNISSLNRHPAMKSSEEHDCTADCFLALYCVVIVRWIARLAQAHSVCVRNKKGDFSPLLLLPAISHQSLCFLWKWGIC